MGSGHYNTVTRTLKAQSSGYYTKSIDEVTSTNLKSDMDPRYIDKRECFDNEDHPNTVPLIIGLDVTGSMGVVPQELIRDGLPHIMDNIIQSGIKDISVCFMAFGDGHDIAPLQVGQFEASDELLDKWLTSTWLEKHGCGNQGEDPSSVWWFAGSRVVTDAWRKRQQKGLIITISDERCHEKSYVRNQFGEKSSELTNKTREELLNSAKEKWNVFHIVTKIDPEDTQGGISILGDWKEFLGEDYVIYEKDVKKIPQTIVDIVNSRYGDTRKLIEQYTPKPTETKVTLDDQSTITL